MKRCRRSGWTLSKLGCSCGQNHQGEKAGEAIMSVIDLEEWRQRKLRELLADDPMADVVDMLRDIGGKALAEALLASFEEPELRQIRDALSGYLHWRAEQEPDDVIEF
jgi:hypothetical protein